MARPKTAAEYVARHPEHAATLEKLIGILESTGLEETIKWGAPVYTLDGKNVVGLGSFQSYAGLWFFQGALLDDPDGVLVNAQEGKTKAMRQWRFENTRQVAVRRVKAYVQEAIENQRSGKKVTIDRDRAIDLPAELEQALARDRAARKAFDALTPGRRREYAEHVATAKREATRAIRLAKVLPMIRAGVGLNDKYRESCG